MYFMAKKLKHTTQTIAINDCAELLATSNFQASRLMKVNKDLLPFRKLLLSIGSIGVILSAVLQLLHSGNFVNHLFDKTVLECELQLLICLLINSFALLLHFHNFNRIVVYLENVVLDCLRQFKASTVT